MGCVSSTLLNQEDEFGHHIVSLTSTTYGFLSTLDNTPTTTVPPTPAARFTLGSEPRLAKPDPSPEVINSWELMAGLDSVSESFRFSPVGQLKYDENENSNPNMKPDKLIDCDKSIVVKPVNNSNSFKQFPDASFKNHSQHKEESKPIPNSANSINYSLHEFENLCPPKGENKAVIYTTTLRGVRTTFEACNAVRAAIQGLGIVVCERDISMDRSFREELRELMKGKDSMQLVPPRVFVKGRYLGGVEEVMRIVEDGCLAELLEGLPMLRAGHVCEGCGDVRFLPCFSCNGSCKMVMIVKEDHKNQSQARTLVVRCPDCNENGLVLCPICS